MISYVNIKCNYRIQYILQNFALLSVFNSLTWNIARKSTDSDSFVSVSNTEFFSFLFIDDLVSNQKDSRGCWDAFFCVSRAHISRIPSTRYELYLEKINRRDGKILTRSFTEYLLEQEFRSWRCNASFIRLYYLFVE